MKNQKNTIQIMVSLKHMGNIAKKVKTYPFPLSKLPHTLRELIEESVRSCVAGYRERTEQSEHPTPLTDEQWNGMREIGKFAFGVYDNGGIIDEAKAIETAIDAVKDGLVRVFHGTSELTELDKRIELKEEDVFTFVKLTMLSGRMW